MEMNNNQGTQTTMDTLVVYCSEQGLNYSDLSTYSIHHGGNGFAKLNGDYEDIKLVCIENSWDVWTQTAEQFIKADLGGKVEFFRDFFGMYTKCIRQNKIVSSDACLTYARLCQVEGDDRANVAKLLIKSNARLFEAILNGKTYEIDVMTHLLECIL